MKDETLLWLVGGGIAAYYIWKGMKNLAGLPSETADAASVYAYNTAAGTYNALPDWYRKNATTTAMTNDMGPGYGIFWTTPDTPVSTSNPLPFVGAISALPAIYAEITQPTQPTTYTGSNTMGEGIAILTTTQDATPWTLNNVWNNLNTFWDWLT